MQWFKLPPVTSLLVTAASTRTEALSIRQAAIQSLVWDQRGDQDQRIVPTLITALGDPDPEIRASAAWGLGSLRAPAAVTPLLALLQDTDSEVRLVAAQSLVWIKDQRAVPGLIAALKNRSASVREAATGVLRGITEQDWGEEVERWKKWWQEHKEELDNSSGSGSPVPR